MRTFKDPVSKPCLQTLKPEKYTTQTTPAAEAEDIIAKAKAEAAAIVAEAQAKAKETLEAARCV